MIIQETLKERVGRFQWLMKGKADASTVTGFEYEMVQEVLKKWS